MKTMRQALRDRSLRSGTVLSLVYFLLLQSLLAGMAQGAMAAATVGPVAVICTSHGLVALDPGADRDAPGDDALRRHCATLCQLASAGTPDVPEAPAVAIAAPRRQGIAVSYIPADIARSAIHALIAEARAPPSSI